jgi:hypothetical protein
MKPRLFTFVFLTFLLITTFAQPTPQSALKGLQFRNIGPYRGGRVTAVAGIATECLLLRRDRRRRL